MPGALDRSIIEQRAVAHREILMWAGVAHGADLTTKVVETYALSRLQLHREHRSVGHILQRSREVEPGLRWRHCRSVLVVSASPLSAARSACQARLAHFPRTGRRGTPESAARDVGVGSSGRAAGLRVTRS